jgi:hypothetical protein
VLLAGERGSRAFFKPKAPDVSSQPQVSAAATLGSAPVHTVRRKLKCDAEAEGDVSDVTASKGRRYCPLRAAQPRGIHLDDLLLGVKLASLAYTDDSQDGTIQKAVGAREALEMLLGEPEIVNRPLTELLALEGFSVDRIFSHGQVLGDIQAVDTQGFIAHSQKDVVLVYRGSTGAVDWLTNLRTTTALFQPCLEPHGHARLFGSCLRKCGSEPGCGRVHHGFYDAMLASRTDIDEVLMPQLRSEQPKRIIVCGHSLGGAIATGALGYLLKKFDFASSPHELLFVTAGQPRFGDKQFFQWLNSEVQRLEKLGKCTALRIVDDYDLVPTVPFRAFGMKHVGKLCLVTHRDELLIGPDVEETEKIPALADYVNDHKLSKYLARLIGAAGI